jgi:arsenite-transporting ATPase
MEQINTIFDPIPIRTINILRDEVVGPKRLSEMGNMIYGDSDPAAILYRDTLYRVDHENSDYTLTIKLPFVTKEYVDLFKEEGDLVIRIGSFKRHVFLPRSLSARKPSKAKLEDNVLVITFPGSHDK